MSAEVLIVGPGYVGGPLGVALADHGARVWGLSRSGRVPEPLHPLAADVADREALRRALDPVGPELQAVVYALSAGGFSDEAYLRAYVTGLENTLVALGGRSVKRFVFTSSTGVYAQTDGGWVDERSPTEPTSFSGRRMLEAEAIVASAPATSIVVRLAGIYGPGRTSTIDRVAAKAKIASAEPRHANRIHQADCVGVLLHLLALPAPPAIVLACDDEPADLAEVEAWLCGELGVDVAELGQNPSTRRRPASDKRCSNRLLRERGYEFCYPSYREGYRELIYASRKIGSASG
jgi:nucleoside-diphosphate-sugar epimerase